MPSAQTLGLRLAGVYGALFVVMGVTLPYWPLFLVSKGASPQQIGWLLAAASLIKLISNPWFGQWADRLGSRKPLLIQLSVCACLIEILFWPAHDFWSLLLITLVESACFASLLPLTDTLTMIGVRSHHLDYGRIRLWGSLSFIAASYLGGQFLLDQPRWMIWAVVLAGHGLVIAAVLALPDWRPGKGTPSVSPNQPQGMWVALSLPRFPVFLTISSLTQLSHTIYYGFATLYWQSKGLSSTAIGAFWAEGVIAEVVLFHFGQRLIRRFGPERFLLWAGMGGVVRWSVLGLTTDPLALISVQWMHALTYGANHLGSMHFIARTAPPDQNGRAQGLYSSITAGLVPGVGFLVGGIVYNSLQGQAFWLMAGLSSVGLGLAILSFSRTASPKL